MSDILYDLVFKGDLAKGADLASAKKNVQSLFKIDAAKVEVLFSGKAVTLKKALSFEAATKYRVAIKKAGAIVELVEQAPANRTPSRGKAVFGVADTGDSSASDSTVKESVSKSSVAESAVSNPEVSAENVSADASVGEVSFELAPPGADVLASTERTVEQPVSVDLSEYALAEQEGNLVEASELQSEGAMVVPETESISLANVGEDILSSEQKHKEPEIDVDLSGVSLAEPGATIVEPSPEEPVDVDISHLSLAD